jgi:chitinase
MKFGLKTSAIYLMLSAAFAAASSPELSGSEIKVASNTKVAASWYASWHETDFPLSKVPWKKYTDVFYAFA